LHSGLESEQSKKRLFLGFEAVLKMRLTRKPKQANELPLPVTGATAGLSSSANHQQDLPPDSVISYNPRMQLPKPYRKLVKHFDDCCEIH